MVKGDLVEAAVIALTVFLLGSLACVGASGIRLLSDAAEDGRPSSKAVRVSSDAAATAADIRYRAWVVQP